ncbi:MAG: hypothetical protein OXB89_10880, partial [Anaerolineaceae bacterium]|nr:hypothetical protein [Anaerolineaceae bacterium]
FQVVLGGQWDENAGSFGLAMTAVPAKSVPEVLDALTDRYVAERERGENFQSWVRRLGRKEVRAMFQQWTKLPAYEEKPDLFLDWGDSRSYSIGDIGVGECAGEVVSLFSIEISKAESEHFDALLALDEGDYRQAEGRSYQAMLMAARALVRTQFLDVSLDADDIVSEFRTRFYDTELFFDRYAKGKFARYLFARHSRPPERNDQQEARRRIEEAQLFIEATHAAEARINGVIVNPA